MKYVNPNIAVDLIAKVPPIKSNARIVWCDGGDAHLGHPKVYINLVSNFSLHKIFVLAIIDEIVLPDVIQKKKKSVYCYIYKVHDIRVVEKSNIFN